MYAGDFQTHTHATNNRERHPGKVDEADGEVRLRRGILPERSDQSTIESDPTTQARNQLPSSHEREDYRPSS